MKPSRILGSDIEVLRNAVAELNTAGIEILSAEVRVNAVPMIHIVAHPEITQLDGRYVHCLFDGITHYAVPYASCEVIWIDPPPVPGALPTDFPPLNAATERTAHHG
jgi:hypothetical protein